MEKESKKAKAQRDKSKAQNGSKKRNADADADFDIDSDSDSGSDTHTNGEAGQDSPKPRMPVPRNKLKKKARPSPKPAPKEKKPRIDYAANPGQFVKQRVAKDFGDAIYYGNITGFTNNGNVVYWRIEYDDGDEEELDKKELRDALKMYDACKHNDSKKPSAEDDISGVPMQEAKGGDKETKEDSKDEASMENGGDEAKDE